MSRLDKLKEQNPELNVSLLDMMTSVEPSDSYKYIPFLIKVLKDEYLKKGNYDALYKGLMITIFGYENLSKLVDFEKHSRANRLEKSDIGTYRNFKDITKAVDTADEIVRLKEVEKQVKKLYDTDTWLVVIPLSYEASKVYGANTKWCTTQEQHWNSYRGKYKLIYIINKKTNVKYAVSCEVQNGEVRGWLANDKESSPFNFPLPGEIFGILASEVQNPESINDMSSFQNKEIEKIIQSKVVTSDMGTISGYSLNLDIKQMMEQTIHETLQSYRNDNDDDTQRFDLPF
jgi:hypothetical protein